jgi:hypothetical protein
MTTETLIEQLKAAGFRVTGGGNNTPSIFYRNEMEETVTIPRGRGRIRLGFVGLKGGTELWIAHIPALAEVDAFMSQSRVFIRSVSDPARARAHFR